MVDSHIIPKSFHGFQGDGKPLKVLTNVEGEHTRKSPQGEYDQIVCLDCERLFSHYDDYAFKLLLGDLWQPEVITYKGQIVEYLLEGVEHEKLRLFALSVLWRAGVSGRKFFGKVELGPFSDSLAAILRHERLSGDDFEVIFGKYSDTEIPLLLDPHPERYYGIKYYRVHLGLFVMYIKVDRRPGPSEFKRETLDRTGRLIVVAREAHGNELRVVGNLANCEHKRVNKGRG